MKFELDDVSREDLEDLILAYESVRPELTARLQAMTAEASGLWTVNAQQAARITELETLVASGASVAIAHLPSESGSAFEPGRIAALLNGVHALGSLHQQSLAACHALEQSLATGAPIALGVADPVTARSTPVATNKSRSVARDEQRARLAELRARLASVREAAAS